MPVAATDEANMEIEQDISEIMSERQKVTS
jgi:hypothetical protein